MNFRKRKSMPNWAACIGAAVLAITTIAPAYAVHDLDIFELEGDALDSDFTASPDDWQTLYENGGHADTTTDPKSEGGDVVIQDPAPGTIFTQGGSKDESDISNPANANDPHVWAHKSGSVPDKDDITNAYAANYVNADNGHQIIYFGADRLANDGDALMGFWFFQNNVSANANGTFSGVHADGDVFVIASFTGGGQVVTEKIMEWDHTCSGPEKGVKENDLVAGQCAGTNLRLKVKAGDAKCDGGSGDTTCAIANTDPETAPWPYTPKQGVSGTFPVASFFEGGLDVTAIFGHSVCFASFLAETRSSSSVDAVLKDFVLGEFNVCSVAASKTCVNDSTIDDTPPLVSPPTPADITYNIRGCAINDGAGAINVTTFSNLVGGVTSTPPAGTTWFNPPASFNPTTGCTDPVALREVTDLDGTDDGTVVANPNAIDLLAGKVLVYQFVEHSASSGPTDTVTIDAEGTGGAPIDAATASTTCPARAFNASLTIDKACAADLEDAGSNLVVKINANGQVCNNGEVQLTNLSLTDNPAFAAAATLGSTTLNPGACTTWSAYYYPSSIPSGDICPFSDSVTATANAPSNTTGTLCATVGGVRTCTSVPDSATCDLRIGNDDNNCATGLTHN